MKCCICGTVKNCQQYLEKVFSNIEKIGTLFEEYVIILYYDKSDDNTLSFLKNYQQNNKNMCYYINHKPLSKYRTHRIAKGRNICLNMIRGKYSDYDFFIMMDFDNVNAKNINLEVLKKNINLDSWDALSFNNMIDNSYYDIWALSIQPYVFSFRHFKDYLFVAKRMHDYIDKVIQNTTKDQLISCLSAFGGFSIYRTSKFLNCHYDGRLRLDLIPEKLIRENIAVLNRQLDFKNDEGTIYEDCEHRSFHLESIRKNNSRIRISSEMLFY